MAPHETTTCVAARVLTSQVVVGSDTPRPNRGDGANHSPDTTKGKAGCCSIATLVTAALHGPHQSASSLDSFCSLSLLVCLFLSHTLRAAEATAVDDDAPQGETRAGQRTFASLSRDLSGVRLQDGRSFCLCCSFLVCPLRISSRPSPPA